MIYPSRWLLSPIVIHQLTMVDHHHHHNNPWQLYFDEHPAAANLGIVTTRSCGGCRGGGYRNLLDDNVQESSQTTQNHSFFS